MFQAPKMGEILGWAKKNYKFCMFLLNKTFFKSKTTFSSVVLSSLKVIYFSAKSANYTDIRAYRKYKVWLRVAKFSKALRLAKSNILKIRTLNNLAQHIASVRSFLKKSLLPTVQWYWILSVWFGSGSIALNFVDLDPDFTADTDMDPQEGKMIRIWIGMEATVTVPAQKMFCITNSYKLKEDISKYSITKHLF